MVCEAEISTREQSVIQNGVLSFMLYLHKMWQVAVFSPAVTERAVVLQALPCDNFGFLLSMQIITCSWVYVICLFVASDAFLRSQTSKNSTS